MKRFKWLLGVPLICVAVAACGGSSNSGTGTGSGNTGTSTAAANGTSIGGKLVIDNESGSTWTCQFNPFNSADFGAGTTFALVYEPLEFVNILQSNNKPVPMLATSSVWSNGYKTLTFTIRHGVKWTDGTPFSAKDVLYTFNAMNHTRAMDLNALWKNAGGPLVSVTPKGSNQVVFKFDSPAQPYFYYVADQTPIVPEHLWKSLNQSKLELYSDSHPVGTGPYKVNTCSAQNINYVRNPSYWKSTPSHPVPRIAQIDYPAYLSNTPANLALSQGQAQWGGQYIPRVKSFYVAGDPAHRHIWYPPVLNVALVPNLDNPLLKNLAVRKAIMYALDKQKISSLGEGGEEQPANQSGVITPTFDSWVDHSLSEPAYDPAKAEQTLEAAGFKKGGNGIFHSPSGEPLSFTIKTISGYSDWDADLQIITEQLKNVGIAVTAQDENSNAYTADLQNGHFQLAYAGSGGPAATPGPSPYYELRGWLFSGNIGSTNYSRYNSSQADSLFREYASADHAKQAQIIDQIQQIMINDIPLIPTTEGVDWYQYDTTNIGGWPTASNPYAQPSPYSFPDDGQVVSHLYPTH